jgi:hypothetical protein
MNNIPKPGGTSKKKGRPRNDLDLNSLAVRQPIPQAPSLTNLSSGFRSETVEKQPIPLSISPVIRSPIDQTPIIVNGKVVNLEFELEERVNNASPVVKPITPVNSTEQYEPSENSERQNP